MARPKSAIPKRPQISAEKEKTTILLNGELKKDAIKALKPLGFAYLTDMIEEGLRLQIKRYEAKRAKG